MNSTRLRLKPGQRRAEPGEEGGAGPWFINPDPWIQPLLKLSDMSLLLQLHEPVHSPLLLFKPI